MLNCFYHKYLRNKYKYFTNVYKTKFKKNALILYITSPFTLKDIENAHQNQIQVVRLSEIISSKMFNIDVVDYNNTTIKLNKKYDLILDIHPGFNPCYYDFMNPGCIRIAYLTGSNHDYSNAAELTRIVDLKNRRGKTVKQRRWVASFSQDSFNSFDAFFLIGNKHTLQTYNDYSLPQQFLIPNTGHSFLHNIYGARNKQSFLFLASDGQVHKGLDLLLEVFAAHTELNLYIFSSFNNEQDFVEIYNNELFGLPNIHAIGWADLRDVEFVKVLAECCFSILPSCSEGMAGSILTTMSAGLIPVVTRNCGVDIPSELLIESTDIDDLDKKITTLSDKPDKWLTEMSEYIRNLTEQNYSIENFVQSINEALDTVLLNRSG